MRTPLLRIAATVAIAVTYARCASTAPQLDALAGNAQP